MATFKSRKIIETLIENNGYYPEDPRAIKIVEYEDSYGTTVWGVVYEVELLVRQNRYDWPTDYIRNPRVIWTAGKE